VTGKRRERECSEVIERGFGSSNTKRGREAVCAREREVRGLINKEIERERERERERWVVKRLRKKETDR
jgi:hypothetical protein